MNKNNKNVGKTTCSGAKPKKIGTFPLPPASLKPLEKVFSQPTKEEKQNC